MAMVIAHDKFHRIEDADGTGRWIVVEVETQDGEHHMTNRSCARAFLAAHMPEEYVIHQYIGDSQYRRADGHPATARRYSVVRIPL